jgi:hypothetical protein
MTRYGPWLWWRGLGLFQTLVAWAWDWCRLSPWMVLTPRIRAVIGCPLYWISRICRRPETKTRKSWQSSWPTMFLFLFQKRQPNPDVILSCPTSENTYLLGHSSQLSNQRKIWVSLTNPPLETKSRSIHHLWTSRNPKSSWLIDHHQYGSNLARNLK